MVHRNFGSLRGIESVSSATAAFPTCSLTVRQTVRAPAFGDREPGVELVISKNHRDGFGGGF
jgi:hypothetical protein